MQTWWRSQFDKSLVTVLFVSMCLLAAWPSVPERVATFALQAAAGLLGCLLTLVTGRRPAQADVLADPTSATTTTTIQSTATVTPPAST